MKDRYLFKNATIEDIAKIETIEKSFFDNGVAFDAEFLKKWFLHNPNMFYVVKKSDDELAAFTILVPITEKLYSDLKLGKVHDMAQFTEEEVLLEIKSEYYYVADIAVNEKKLAPTLILIKGITKFLGDNAHWVMTTPITKDGLSFCKTMGFCSAELGKNCELEVNSSLRNRYVKR